MSTPCKWLNGGECELSDEKKLYVNGREMSWGGWSVDGVPRKAPCVLLPQNPYFCSQADCPHSLPLGSLKICTPTQLARMRRPRQEAEGNATVSLTLQQRRRSQWAEAQRKRRQKLKGV